MSSLPKLPIGWRYEPLASLCDESRGISYGVVQPGQPANDGVPILRVNNLTRGRLRTDDVLRISPEIEEKHSRTRLRGGELLISLVGSVGEVATVPASFAGWNTARAIGVVPVLPEHSPQWVKYWLGSAYAKAHLFPRLNTTVQATLNLRDLAALPVPMPPKSERDARAAVAGALDDKIESNRKISETLEAIARTLFRSWFIDFGPVRAKIEGRRTDLHPDLAEHFPETLDGDPELPEGWRHRTLGEVLEVAETGSRPKGGVAGITEGVPSVGAESIEGLAKFDFSKTKFVGADFYQSMNKGRVSDRDVILYKDGGRPGMFEPHTTFVGHGFPFEQFCINEHVYRLRARAPFSQEFLYFHLTSEPCEAEMRERGTGVAIPGLNSTELRALRVIDPGREVLEAFEAETRPLVSRALRAAKQSHILSQVRDRLLPKLLSGELRVADAGPLAADAGA